MRKLLSFYTLVLTLALNGCSDDTVTPDNNSNNNGGNGGDKDSTSFVVVTVDKDSVLWEDIVTVTLKHATTDSFIVFVHTVPMSVDSAWRTTDGNAGVRFRVPDQASTGAIRIFEHDTIQAKGNFTLVVYPKRRSTVNPRITDFGYQRYGYVGDLFMIDGHDLQFVGDDFSVRVNDIELPIVTRDSTTLITRIAPGIQTGPVTVRLLHKIFIPGTFNLVEQGRVFQPDNEFTAMFLQAKGLAGSGTEIRILGRDTTITGTPYVPEFGYGTGFENVTVTESGDSIIVIGDETLQGGYKREELRLKREPDSRVSGVIRSSWEFEHDKESIEVEIKNMRWMLAQGAYQIYSNSFDISNELISYSHSKIGSDKISESLIYEGGTLSASFVVYLQMW